MFFIPAFIMSQIQVILIGWFCDIRNSWMHSNTALHRKELVTSLNHPVSLNLLYRRKMNFWVIKPTNQNILNSVCHMIKMKSTVQNGLKSICDIINWIYDGYNTVGKKSNDSLCKSHRTLLRYYHVDLSICTRHSSLDNHHRHPAVGRSSSSPY